MKWGRNLVLFIAVAALSACATMPTGPSVMVLPGPGKPFDVFQYEDQQCRNWAERQTGKNPSEIANQNLVNGAAIGTLVGAGLGAAIGSASGNAGAGAGIGAASGLIGGAAVASGPASAASWGLQRRYDIAYEQCMYAKGNIIPGVVRTQPQASPAPPPPPPPGYKPEPPPPPPADASAPPPQPYPQQ